MCGIVGWIGRTAESGVCARMRDALSHRGPDDAGMWSDPDAGVWLAHRRLSVLDLSAFGHQPMSSPSARFVIVFNGEIYNHLSLREALERDGFDFAWRGHSDTETLLAGFESWGIRGTVERAVGMFAFAVWDRRSDVLTLGRDRMGEKPLYYGRLGGTFLFASELKALTAFPSFNGEIDRDALADFIKLSYIPAPRSIYRGIYKLMPGTLLDVPLNAAVELEPSPYWSLVDVATNGSSAPFAGTETEAIEALRSKLVDAVSLQQITDVPIGAFLSGGIDSSMIAALMQAQSSRPINTFTIGFNEEHYDEARHARAVADHLGTGHSELYVSSEEASSVVPHLSRIYDEPFADSSQIPTLLVSQLARQKVTVSLSGDAGDELFGGYNRYFQVRKLLNQPAWLRKAMASVLSMAGSNGWQRLYNVVAPMLPTSLRSSNPSAHFSKLASVLQIDTAPEIFGYLISTWPSSGGVVLGGRPSSDIAALWAALARIDEPEHRMMVLDATLYLPGDILCKLDRAAMSVSLETRVPFLDHRVVEFAWSLPLAMKVRDGRGKWLLRQLLYKFVPRELVERPKMGLGVPIGDWLRGSLREWAEDRLTESRLASDGYLDVAKVRTMWAEHLSGSYDRQYQLWNVLMFQEWLHSYR